MSVDLIAVEREAFEAVRSYYERDYRSCKHLVVYISTMPRFKPRWWVRFLIDFKAWEAQVKEFA